MIPLNDVVIIRKDKETERGGIQLLDAYKDPAGTDTGVVLQIGRGYKNEYGTWVAMTDVELGKQVLFLRKHGIAVKGEKDLVVVRYNNLLAVIEP